MPTRGWSLTLCSLLSTRAALTKRSWSPPPRRAAAVGLPPRILYPSRVGSTEELSVASCLYAGGAELSWFTWSVVEGLKLLAGQLGVEVQVYPWGSKVKLDPAVITPPGVLTGSLEVEPGSMPLAGVLEALAGAWQAQGKLDALIVAGPLSADEVEGSLSLADRLSDLTLWLVPEGYGPSSTLKEGLISQSQWLFKVGGGRGLDYTGAGR